MKYIPRRPCLYVWLLKIELYHIITLFVFALYSWSKNLVSDFHSNQKNNNYAEGKCNLICWQNHAYSINIKAQPGTYFGMHAIGIFLISWDVFMKFMLRWKILFPLIIRTFQYIFFALMPTKRYAFHWAERFQITFKNEFRLI